MTIRELTIEDYDAMHALWKASLASVRDIDDSREAIARFLARNPGMSAAAVDDAGKLIGTILCGHDGRRAFLYHVAVDAAHRRAGVGQAMLETCLAALRAEGIPKCSLIAFTNNGTGNAFWEAMGFRTRLDVNYRDIWLNEK